MTSPSQHRSAALWLAVAGLLFFWALRLHQLMALPFFIDEALSAVRSRDTLAGSALWFGVHGKLLLPWWGVFFTPAHQAPFVLRLSLLILTLLTPAVAYGLARRLAGPVAGLMALLLVAAAPMLFFFDRMLLSDTLLHVVTSLLIYALFRLYRRPAPSDRASLLVGGLLVICVLAKVTALAILPLVVVAAALLPHHWPWRDRLRSVVMAYGAALLLWLPLQALLLWRGVNFLGMAAVRSGSAGLPFLEKAALNLQFLLDALIVYFGVPFLLVALIAWIAALVAHRRAALTLLAVVLGPGLAIALIGNVTISTRYWLWVMPPALMLMGLGLAAISHGLARRWPAAVRWRLQVTIPALVLLPFAALVGLPFMLTAYSAPADLPLPRSDRVQYIEADSAGTGLPETAAFIRQQAASDPALRVVGAFVQCDALAMYVADAARVDCPDVLGAGRRGAWLDDYITQRAADGPLLAVFESPGYADPAELASSQFEPLATFPRPGGRSLITVYRALVAD